MASGLPDYHRRFFPEYDADADIRQGPGLSLTWATEKDVDNTGAVWVLQGKQKRVGLIIQAKASNTGIVYLGFDSNVTTTKWFAELQPGMAFCDNSWCGDIYAIANVAAVQKVGWADW